MHHDQAACNLLYSFQGPDGARPAAGLIAVKDTLYGTTTGGYVNGGTVFSYKSGKENVLHSFTGVGEGYSPYARLLAVGKTLYGTTQYGGTYNYGTVFSITTGGGKYRVLHNFGGEPDGANPVAELINVGGTLYGTTTGGGSNHGGPGTVYSITKSGVEKVIYSFKNEPDGANPYAGLIYYKGAFYGTTYFGGNSSADGTVFKLTPDGTETVLHSFTGQPDGENTYGTLIEYKGNFYGTNPNGGANGTGSVFEVSPSGEESVLYSFPQISGGVYYAPHAGLIEVKGTFYGTSQGFNGPGPIFSVTPEGVENVVCTFMGSGNTYSVAPLLYFDGALYGTTYNEGSDGYGGIFNVAL